MGDSANKDIIIVGDLFRDLFDKYNKMENKKYLFKDLKDLTLIEINTIIVIGPEGMKSMSEIANSLGVTLGTPTVTIDRLISKEYVERKRDEVDRRQVFVSLSESGIKVYNSVVKLRKSITEKIFSILTPGEIKELIAMMSKINDKYTEVLDAHDCEKGTI